MAFSGSTKKDFEEEKTSRNNLILEIMLWDISELLIDLLGASRVSFVAPGFGG